jgi:hypothetical protein
MLLQEFVIIRIGLSAKSKSSLKREALLHLEWDLLSGMEVILMLEWSLTTI